MNHVLYINEPSTVVIVIKRTGTPSFRTPLISVLLFGSNDSTSFKIYFCQRVKKRDFRGF